MNLNLTREVLLEPLQKVMGVVEQKQTLPILSNILLKLEKSSLYVMGTDLEVELIGQSILPQATVQDKQITIPGRKLIDICKALPENAAIELYQEKEQIVLKSGKSRFTLSTLPADEFPNMKAIKPVSRFTIAQNELRHLLKRTCFAMAQHDVRYYLNGILLEVMAGGIRAVATDGHRLALNTVEVKTNVDHRIQIIIPRKATIELMRLLEDSNTPIDIILGNNSICAKTNDYTFTSKLIEGRFPEYERVIPKNLDKVISISKQELKEALQRTAILCNEKFRGVRLELRTGLLRMLANNPEHEAAEEEIAIEYSGDDLDIGFNVSYLLENLTILKSETISMKLKDGNSSMLLEEQNLDFDSIFVIMPMRL